MLKGSRATMQEVWAAFSTLSDAQELIQFALEKDPTLGELKQANATLNHAKRHLHEVFEQDSALLTEAVMFTALHLDCDKS